MSEQGRTGGIHIGNVGHDVSFEAGGDIVGGDKTASATFNGFRSEDDKLRFQSELETLRELLREAKQHIEASTALTADAKDELVSEILERVKQLKEAKEEAAPIVTGQAPPGGVAKRLETHLDGASSILDKLQAVAGKGADLAGKVGTVVARYGPLVLSLRSLLGLP